MGQREDGVRPCIAIVRQIVVHQGAAREAYRERVLGQPADCLRPFALSSGMIRRCCAVRRLSCAMAKMQEATP